MQCRKLITKYLVINDRTIKKKGILAKVVKTNLIYL